MILRPSATLTLGNLRYDSHVVHFEICLGLLPRGVYVCAGGATTAMLPDAALADPSDASTDGGRDAGTACSAFGDVSLTLMSEWCVCPPGDCPSTSQGTVRT